METIIFTDPETGEKKKYITKISISQITKIKKQRKEKDKQYSYQLIAENIDLHGLIDNNDIKSLLSRAISLLPREVIDYIMENIIIIADSYDDTGSYYGTNDYRFKNAKGFIFFSPGLWKKSKIEIAKSVAHEVAHAWGKHDIDEYKKTEEEISIKEEIDADKLAVKWLKKYFKEKDLKKLCHYWGNKEWEKKRIANKRH